MEFADFHLALADLLQAARHTLRTELTSVWLPIQLCLIGLGAVIARAVAGAIRKRADFVSLTMGWPPLLRMIVRALVSHLGLIAFIIVLTIVRASIREPATNASSSSMYSDMAVCAGAMPGLPPARKSCKGRQAPSACEAFR